MIPDDIFRRRRNEAILALTRWADGLRDVAAVDVEPAPRYWRLAVRPHTSGACPFEAVIHNDQRCDLAIGSEIIENEPAGELTWLVALAEAVSAGRIVTRASSSALTDRLVAVETSARLSNGTLWQRIRRVSASSGASGGGEVARTRHYLPYRCRAGG